MNQNLTYIVETFKEETFNLLEEIDYSNIDSVFRVFHTAKSSFALYEIESVSKFIHNLEDVISKAKSANRQLLPDEVELFQSAVDSILKATLYIMENMSDDFPVELAEKFSTVEAKDEIQVTPKSDDNFIKIYLITIDFSEDLLQFGNDPYSYLKELNSYGEIEKLSTLSSDIPDLTVINPLQLYLSVEALYRSKLSTDGVVEIFEFIEDDIEIDIIELYKIREIQNESRRVSQRSETLQISKDKFKAILQSAETQSRESLFKTLYSVGFSPLNSLIEFTQQSISAMESRFGKKIDFIYERNSFEIDKNIYEILKESLHHLIRNSIDHGFKTADSGEIKLSFSESHNNNKPQLTISFCDNGGGIDPYKIIDKAVKEGFEIPNRDLFSLLFTPAFSTTDSVSELSGRGIGLSAVKSNISEIGGDIRVESKVEKGTEFHITIPLSLLLINSVELQVGEVSILVPVERVSFITGKRVLPRSIDLGKILKIESENSSGVVVEIGGKKVELLCNSVKQDIRLPLKFLSSYFRDVEIFSSYSTLSDGRVAFVLDIDKLGGYIDE
jgi:two-component system chemotaxis sensor kinase CheA